MQKENIRQQALEQAARGELTRREAARLDSLSASQKENIRQEQATYEELPSQEMAKGEKFRRDQENQHALQKLEALRRLGVTGLSTSKYADKSPNVVVRGRGAVKYVSTQPPASYAAQEPPAKVFSGQVPNSARVWEDELSVNAEPSASGSSFPQRSAYMAQEVAVQHEVKVKVERSPVEVESPQIKREIEAPHLFKTEAPPARPVLNAWQQYLADQANRR